jgi:hypothetical protein
MLSKASSAKLLGAFDDLPFGLPQFFTGADGISKIGSSILIRGFGANWNTVESKQNRTCFYRSTNPETSITGN